MVTFALNIASVSLYNMGMKLKQLISFLLVIPFMAASVNLAAAGQAMDELRSVSMNANRGYDGAAVRKGGYAPLYVDSAKASTAWTAPDPKPVEAKSTGEKVKEFIKSNKPKIAAGLVGGLIGFLLFGPAGIIGGALLMIAAKMYIAL